MGPLWWLLHYLPPQAHDNEPSVGFRSCGDLPLSKLGSISGRRHSVGTVFLESLLVTCLKIMKNKKQLRPLLPYMPKALAYCRLVTHPALFMEMRLRKSPIVIRACRYYKSKSILIVSPYSAFGSWQYWLEQEKEAPAVELVGTSEQRFSVLTQTPGKYFIINKEGYLALPQISDTNWDAVVLDESRFIHNPAKFNRSERFGKRSNSSKFFCSNFRDIPHRFILSGLPAPESELEYFEQLRFLNPDIIGIESYWHFRHRYFGEIFPGKHVMFRNKKKIFVKKLREHCFFLSRKDAGVGGQKIFVERFITQDTKFKKVYRKLAKEFVLQYENIEKRTKFSPVKFAWLRQLCSGFVDGKLLFKDKVNALIDLLDNEIGKRQVVIWCCFTCEIETLNKKIKGSRIINGSVKPKERNKIKEDFRKGKFTRLIIQVETEKQGVDFAFVKSPTMIYFSLPLGLDTFKQTSDRMIDAGKTDSILLIPFLMEKSIEIKIFKSLQKKDSLQKTIGDMVKHLKEVLK